MKSLLVLVGMAVTVSAVAQSPRPLTPVPEFSDDRPQGVPDTTTWATTGESQAGAILRSQEEFTPVFLGVLKPEGICSKRPLPCAVIMRFSFWSRGNDDSILQVGRFVIGNPDKFIEAAAVTDRLTFSYWVRGDGTWRQIKQGTELYKAHHEFYQFLQLLQLASKVVPPKPSPPKDQKKVIKTIA